MHNRLQDPRHHYGQNIKTVSKYWTFLAFEFKQEYNLNLTNVHRYTIGFINFDHKVFFAIFHVFSIKRTHNFRTKS